MQRIPPIVLAIALGCGPGIAQEKASNDRRPDIVLFIADDLTWLDCGVYGSPDVKTPNIDQLAKDGMRFDRMFTLAMNRDDRSDVGGVLLA